MKRIKPLPARTTDGLSNVVARLGVNGTNAISGGTYRRSGLSLNQQLLETMYESSWVAGKLVDCIAEDMTRAGVVITDPSDQVDEVHRTLTQTQCWTQLTSLIKWARLYGGALAVMLIDGQDLASPLLLNRVTRASFKGLKIFDRWRVTPESGPVDMSEPEFYTMPSGQRIHASRVLRQIGTEVPYWAAQRLSGWGASVLERADDRILAYDSVTMGAANLVFKAHLRTMQIDRYREVLAQGGRAEENLIKSLKLMQTLQTNEGLTVMDKEDTFATHSYAFAGLSDVMLQFGQQVSAASGIPLVRLFGQSPAGLNASGDADFRNYYDNVNAIQEARLRPALETLLQVVYRSTTGNPPPVEYAFEFASLWQKSDTDKAAIAKTTAETVTALVEADIIDKATALRELQASSLVTGFGASITDEQVEEADEQPPEPVIVDEPVIKVIQ